jgi:nucleoside-diphosphate-sugar epimerase
VSPSRDLHVVFGAGQIGTPLARRLHEQGHAVRLVRRKGTAPAGVDLELGDACDARFAMKAADGAAVVYHCMNPAYSASRWRRDLPRLMHGLMDAAAHEGARLVVLDNLYMLGLPRTRPFDEDTPMDPCSRKGEVRAQVAEMLLDAMRRGHVRACIGRASDFYGPGGSATFWGDAFWPEALAKGTAPLLFDPTTPHSYHYTADVAAALATLGTASDEVEGKVWMLPCDEAEPSTAMIERFGRALGRELIPRRMSRSTQRWLGYLVPMLRELAEMSYQWDAPFVVDDRRYRSRFGPTPTRLDDGARATVAWAREHYARKR